MRESSEIKGAGISGISISVISNEMLDQKTKEVDPTTAKEIKGPSNTEDGTDYAINSQQHLFTEDAPPKMMTQVLGALVVAWTHMGIGTIYGFPGVTLPQLTQPDSDDIYLTPNNAALFGSLVNIGAAIGSVTSGIFLVRFGQRLVLLVALPITLSAWLLHAFSHTIWLLLVARFLLGFIVGLISTAANTYVMEIAHKTHRGLLFAILPTTRQLGFFFIASVGSSTLNWRYISLVCGFVTALPAFLGLFFFPNSPRWLVTRGRIDDAENSLIFFRGPKYDIKSEIKAIVDQVNQQQNIKSNFLTQLHLLGKKSTLPNFLILLFITIVSSFNGSFVTVTYLVPIFQASSSDINPYISAMLVGAVRVVGTLVSLAIIDRLGRRPLLISSYIVNSFSLAVLGLHFYAEKQIWDMRNFGWLPLTSLLIYTFSVCIGTPILSLVRGELLPTPTRAVGVSLLVTAMFSGGFVGTLIYPQTTAAVGEHGAFWIYSSACAVVAIFSLFALPETSGKSLEEITREQKAVHGDANIISSQETIS